MWKQLSNAEHLWAVTQMPKINLGYLADRVSIQMQLSVPLIHYPVF